MTRRPLCLVCLIFMMCMCLGDLAGMSLIRGNPLPEQVQEYISTHPDAVIVGEVQRCQATDVSFSVYLKQVSLICRSEKIPIENVRVFLKKKEEISAGSLISVSGKLEQTEPPRNPGEFDSRQYYACEHIYYFMKQGIIRKKSTGSFGYQQMLLNLKDRIRAVLRKCAGRDSPVFEAMLLGEKSDLEEARKLRYQMAGMIHILAISGVKTLKLDIPLVPETRINWAFVPLHIAIIYILKLCLDEEIIPRCRFPCSRGYFTKCINWQKKQ